MYLIDDSYNKIETFEQTVKQRFWIYDITKNDFFVKTCMLWQNITSASYHVQFGNRGSIWIPYNYHIIIGDYEQGLDSITMEELMGRDFQAFTFAKELEVGTMNLEDIKIIGYDENKDYTLPFIKTTYPILINDDTCILISANDCYNRIKHNCISDIL